MQQRGGNVGRAEALLEQTPDELFLPLEFAALERQPDPVEHHIGARLLHLTYGGRQAALNPRLGKALDVANLK
jgi:hypothetical protein